MATQTKTTTPSQADTEQVADRIRELNEQAIEVGRTAGLSYLEAYERTLHNVADYQERVAENSQVDWVTNMLRAQASFTRDVTGAYAASTRDLLQR